MPETVRFRMQDGAEDLAPKKSHVGDAAFDLRASADVLLPAAGILLVPTGLHLELPGGFEAQVRPRSGLALKHGVTVHNSPGTIDSGYRGEVGIILFNASAEDYQVTRGDRIAQMVIQKLPEVELVSVEALQDSHRGEGGFGSTGRR